MEVLATSRTPKNQILLSDMSISFSLSLVEFILCPIVPMERCDFSKSNFGLLVLLLLTYQCCNETPEGREHNVNKEEEVKPGPFNQTFSTMIAATFLYTLLTLFYYSFIDLYIQLLLSKLHYRSPSHNLYMVT